MNKRFLYHIQHTKEKGHNINYNTFEAHLVVKPEIAKTYLISPNQQARLRPQNGHPSTAAITLSKLIAICYEPLLAQLY